MALNEFVGLSQTEINARIASGANYANIAGAATTVLKTGAGRLVKIIINKAVASGVITIYDNTSAAGSKIGTITNPAVLLQSQLPVDFNIDFGIGLTIVTSAADDITVVYK